MQYPTVPALLIASRILKWWAWSETEMVIESTAVHARIIYNLSIGYRSMATLITSWCVYRTCWLLGESKGMEKDDCPRYERADRGERVSVEPEKLRRLVSRTSPIAPAAPPSPFTSIVMRILVNLGKNTKSIARSSSGSDSWAEREGYGKWGYPERKTTVRGGTVSGGSNRYLQIRNILQCHSVTNHIDNFRWHILDWGHATVSGHGVLAVVRGVREPRRLLVNVEGGEK